MFHNKYNRITAFILALVLVTSITTADLTASAASDTTTSAAQTGEAPSGGPPSGGAPGGNAPSSKAPEGNAPSGDAPSGGAPGGGGANIMTYDYTGTHTGLLTADGKEVSSRNESYTTSTADENAAIVENAGTLAITNGTFTKSGDDTNGDNCNFYGLNSILLAINSGSKAYISDSKLSADSEGSNGIFATDSAEIYANNDTISTTAGNSRGLDATYNGTIVANQMDITTKGDHCASIATDRGGGNISVTNSKLSTAGSGSPLLYSTGNIQIDNVTGTATGSQIAGMEGLNTILIYNSNLMSTLTKATASDPIADGIIIYQSTSGDAESKTGEAASFEVSNSTLKSAIASGAMFYITNTSANVVLSGTTLDFDSSNVNLMVIEGNNSNNWGTAGSNGATVNFTGLGETLSGNISVDTISNLNFYLLKSTTYTGAMSIATNSVNTSISSAPITVNLDSTSKWVVTGNSTVTNLNAESGAAIVDASGKTVTIIANGKTVSAGTSEYTIKVTGSYGTTVTTSSTNELSASFIDRTNFDSYYGTSTVFGQNASTVTGTPQVQTQTAAESTEKTESNHTLIFVITIAAGAIAVAATITVKKKKNDKHEQ
jgi:hypothetical protein